MSDCGRSADRTRQTTTAARWDRGQQQVRDLPSAVSTSTVITGSHVCSSRLINLWRIIIIRPPDNSREGLKFYPRTYFFIFFSIHRAQQPRCYQMYFGGSVLGRPKASTKNRDLAHPPNFYRGGGRVKKCEIWRRFQHHSNLSRSKWKCSKISERWNKFLV